MTKPPSLADRLAPYLTAQATRFSGVWTVCALSGATIGAALSGGLSPETAAGNVLLALATSLVSSVAYDAIKPDLDDEQRADILAKGLEANDPAVQRLVAASLASSVPTVFAQLPAAHRSALAAHIGTGLNASGGVAAQIAKPIQDALVQPPDDWAAFQRQLQQQITSVQLTMEARDEAEMQGNVQRVDQATGATELRMTATGKSKMENNQQIVSGATPAANSSPAPTPLPRDPALNDPAHLQNLIDRLVEYVQIRETQVATLGSAATKQQLNEIAEFTAKIDELRALLVR